MRLTRPNALLLHNILFHYTMANESSMDPEDEDSVLQLQKDLKSFILDIDSSAQSDEAEDAVETDEDSEEEEEEAEDHVTASDLDSLTALGVTASDGRKATLEFESVYGNTVDALLDEGSEVIEEVDHIKITDGAVELYADGQWRSFPLRRKLPSSWKKVLEEDRLYKVVPDSEADDSEDEDE